MVALRRGSLDALAPQSDAGLWAIARSEFPSPYLREAQMVNIPSRPDFLAAGDFIGMNGAGMAAAARGGRSLDVVSRGESRKIEALQTLGVTGTLTAVGTAPHRPGGNATVGWS